MNVKAFEAEQFAYQHYTKLLKCRPAIDASSPKRQRVPYSSRNLTHMTRYEQQIKTNKLVNKLVQIHDANLTPKYFNNKSGRKRKVSKKNRQLTFSQNKTYLSLNKTLVNPFKLKEKQSQIKQKNFDIIEKLSFTKSDYKKAFGKQRENRLKNYSKILKKSKQDEQIRDSFFQMYSKIKMSNYVSTSPSRPQSSRRTCKTSKIVSQATTRPQTAR